MEKTYLKQREVVLNNLIKALEFHNGNRTHTAKGLGIGIRTLQRSLKKASLETYLLKTTEDVNQTTPSDAEATAQV